MPAINTESLKNDKLPINLRAESHDFKTGGFIACTCYKLAHIRWVTI